MALITRASSSNSNSNRSRDDANGCLGTLIAPRFVLSTASCVSRLFPSGEDGATTGIVLISTPRTRPEADEELPIAPNGIKLHPKWTTSNNHSFDFATVELAAPSFHLYAAVEFDLGIKNELRRL